MGGTKRPKLFERSASARIGSREPVWIAGAYRIGDGPMENVAVTDISANGCRVQAVPLGATKSEPVHLRLGGGPVITGRLKWIKQASIGVGFDVPLDDEALAQAERQQSANVVPLKRSPLR